MCKYKLFIPKIIVAKKNFPTTINMITRDRNYPRLFLRIRILKMLIQIVVRIGHHSQRTYANLSLGILDL